MDSKRSRVGVLSLPTPLPLARRSVQSRLTRNVATEEPQRISHHRQIGPIGTVSRAFVGLLFLVGLGIPGGVTTVHGQYRYRFDAVSVILGALVFPAVVLSLHWLAVRHRSTPLRATGSVATTINLLLLLGLFLIPEVAPPIYFIATGAAVFYGLSMLLAALRGRAGCEVTAIPNWILGRDDQVGCPVFTPLDSMEHRAKTSPQR